MAWALAYRLEHDDFDLRIYDKEAGEAGDTTFIDVEGSGSSPILLSSINNDESKYSPIRALQLQISIISTGTIKASIFAEGADDRYLVELIKENKDTWFTGYVVMDEIEQAFQDEEDGYEIRLTATDNIALLKDVPLGIGGRNLKGVVRIIDIITFCLRHTGLDLPIVVQNSIMSIHNGGTPMYEVTWLDVKTFEEEINLSENCYTVLEKILAGGCFLTQHKGWWYISRVDEIESDTVTQHIYVDGILLTSQVQTIDQYIGFTEDMWFMNESATVGYERPASDVLTLHKLETPLELFPNIDLGRGDGELSSTATEIRYYVDDWKYRPEFGVDNTYPVYIRAIMENDYEKERYLVFGTGTTVTAFGPESGVFVNAKDKFVFSIDARNSDTYTPPTSGQFWYQFGRMKLIPDDGSTHYHLRKDGKWVNAQEFLESNLNYAINDPREWQSYSVECQPCPKNGMLELTLFQGAVPTSYEKHYQNIQFNYLPYIQGSYRKYNAIEWKSNTGQSVRKKEEIELYLGTSPNRNFKGSLLRQTGFVEVYNGDIEFFSDGSIEIPGNYSVDLLGRYVVFGGSFNTTSTYVIKDSSFAGGMTTLYVNGTIVSSGGVVAGSIFAPKVALSDFFYDGNLFGSVPSNTDYHWTYNQILTINAYNQYKRRVVIMDGDIQGVDSYPHLVNSFFITDPSENTTGKTFMLLHWELDTAEQSWRGTFKDVFDSTGKDIDIVVTNKYLS